MKTSLIIAITTAILLTFGNIFSTYKVPQAIFNAIENGNSKKLASYFNQNIDLLIIDKSGVYNKGQAEILIKDFLEENNPNSFELIQQTEQINSSFAICNMKNENGEKFSIYILVQKFEGKSVITKLKIKTINN
jgi:Domain of unknown function (DUF4783)